MSNFLDKLKDALEECDFTSETGVDDLIESLGENARRMLEIGIVQDELVKLEFGLEIFNKRLSLTTIDSMFNEEFHHVQFWTNCVAFRGEVFYYKLPTWQQDLLTKVKDVIK